MDELIEWFEDRHDADAIVDILDITVEDLCYAFPERAREYQLYCESSEDEALEKGF